jgi:hypothetical protein
VVIDELTAAEELNPIYSRLRKGTIAEPNANLDQVMAIGEHYPVRPTSAYNLLRIRSDNIYVGRDFAFEVCQLQEDAELRMLVRVCWTGMGSDGIENSYDMYIAILGISYNIIAEQNRLDFR